MRSMKSLTEEIEEMEMLFISVHTVGPAASGSHITVMPAGAINIPGKLFRALNSPFGL